jgi:nucleotide-binding universal stress UspA family protein
MSYKALLTHVVDDRGCASRLRMTTSVARVLNTEVIGLGAQAPWPFSNPSDGHGRDFNRLVQNSRDAIARAEAVFRENLRESQVSLSWRAEVAYPDTALANAACAADLVLAYRTTGYAYRATGDIDASLYAAPDSVVMEAGLPVLLMPAKESEFKADTILLAWKNTRESRRAITANLPLLARAKRVLVAAVCHRDAIETVEKELADVSGRLARHGVNAATLAEVDAPGAAGRRLLRIAQTDQSDLIVAGGYGHSRLREWILGGVTRDLIDDGRRYILLTH